MAFRTKLDYSDNRQIKQFEKSHTILSGGTSFGLTFSALTSGPNLETSGDTETYTTLASTFSGNGTTTIYNWYDPIMAIGEPYLSAITPSLSATTQLIEEPVFSAETTTVIDGNTVGLFYTGVTFDITPIAFYDLGGGNYSGTVETLDLTTYSATSLDYTGRTIWVDVSGITRTERLIVTNAPQIGYVLTCYTSEGMAKWEAVTGVTISGGSILWSSGTGTYSIAAKNYNSIASGNYSVASGYNALASGNNSHVEGAFTTASGYISHAEGSNSQAIGDYSHAEGANTLASGTGSHAEGGATTASNQGSHAEGGWTTASGINSHAEGNYTIASGDYGSHAEGYKSLASGEGSHAEGGVYSLLVSGGTASGKASHAEGRQTTASGDYSHAEGYYSTADGEGSHAEGGSQALGVLGGVALGGGSHAEGGETTAIGNYSHAEGFNTRATGYTAHAEGAGTRAYGQSSHAEGASNVTIGLASHAEGEYNTARGRDSHVGGNSSVAFGDYSFVHGNFSTAFTESTIVLGDNINGSVPDTTYVDRLNIKTLAVYADNAAATSGGLEVGTVYRTSTGQLMVRY
jgi:hypothetical protein